MKNEISNVLITLSALNSTLILNIKWESQASTLK